MQDKTQASRERKSNPEQIQRNKKNRKEKKKEYQNMAQGTTIKEKQRKKNQQHGSKKAKNKIGI